MGELGFILAATIGAALFLLRLISALLE